ncbi:hypothetical protein [Caproiciproducens sp. CPB-2]|uniref:hypothetical protein n=1 Tax=Caproiciproducens sp. CPB-2 TaxID=3030017 RepID=UPI0023DC5955|nr:hypothetical protein [Caproiciproducens sp. CPB-2]MDF1496326.1 hypothetical protein [Caproiciproducens sp. CPB-2]
MNEETSTYQIVSSIRIATSLVADYPFFKDLMSIERNKSDTSRRVWFFRRSPEFDKVFNELVEESRQYKKQRLIENMALSEEDKQAIIHGVINQLKSEKDEGK